jgi:hypothetical protein
MKRVLFILLTALLLVPSFTVSAEDFSMRVIGKATGMSPHCKYTVKFSYKVRTASGSEESRTKSYTFGQYGGTTTIVLASGSEKIIGEVAASGKATASNGEGFYATKDIPTMRFSGSIPEQYRSITFTGNSYDPNVFIDKSSSCFKNPEEIKKAQEAETARKRAEAEKQRSEAAKARAREAAKDREEQAARSGSIVPGSYVVRDHAQNRYVAVISTRINTDPSYTKREPRLGNKYPLKDVVGVIFYVLPTDVKPGGHKLPDVDKGYNWKYSRLVDAKLDGVWSEDGKVNRHVYIIGLNEYDSTWPYATDNDNVNAASEFQVHKIRKEGSTAVGYTGADLYKGATDYNNRRGVSHRVKPNHWAVTCNTQNKLPGNTSGWFIPTRSEIMLMANTDLITNALVTIHCTPIHDKVYWTIEEASNTTAVGWRCNKGKITIIPAAKKQTNCHARAIAVL